MARPLSGRGSSSGSAKALFWTASHVEEAREGHDEFLAYYSGCDPDLSTIARDFLSAFFTRGSRIPGCSYSKQDGRINKKNTFVSI